MIMLNKIILLATAAAESEEAADTVGNALAILGMPPKDWITIIVTILGVTVTIISLRSSIRSNFKKTRAEISKEYLSEMLHLLKELIDSLNIAASHAKECGFQFDLDPDLSPGNNVFIFQILPDNDEVNNKTRSNQERIIRTYARINEKNKTAAMFDKSVDKRIWLLSKHIREVIAVRESEHPVDDYRSICKTEFPDIDNLKKLIRDTENVLFS